MSILLEDAPGKKALLMGNEALVRGAYEAGLNFACSYPGTPSSEVSSLLFGLQDKAKFRMEFATNEKVAMEAVAGAALGGLNALTAMKHVGLNVAADPLGTLTYIGVRGALVVYCADDPSLFSSQNEQDNRAYARMFGLPLFEPATAQEMKDMTVEAFGLSRRLGMPVMLRSTTRVAHLRGVVELGPIAPLAPTGRFVRDPRAMVTLPANAVRMHKELLERLEKARAYGEEVGKVNILEGPVQAEYGVVASGVSVNYVRDALAELGLADKVGLFVLGFTYPEPNQAMLKWMQGKKKILVVEELEPFVENWLKVLAQENEVRVKVRGKGVGALSRLYEYNAAMVRQAVAQFFEVADVSVEKLDLSDRMPLPVRPPNLCPGCPHRMTYYAVKKACAGRDVVFPNDIGCYSLGFGVPLQSVDTILCMGASASMPCGLSVAQGEAAKEQHIVSFIGDSTFFHSGMTGIANAVYNGHKYTLVVLDNQVTAMTGHQPSPALDPDADHRAAIASLTPIDLEAVLKALGVPHVQVVRPTNVKKMQEAMREALDYDGLSVIISREPCPLHHKRQGGKTTKMVYTVDQTRCNQCRTCITTYGCPAFQPVGDTVTIDPTQCAGCAVCVQVCPEKAIRPLKD